MEKDKNNLVMSNEDDNESFKQLLSYSCPVLLSKYINQIYALKFSIQHKIDLLDSNFKTGIKVQRPVN